MAYVETQGDDDMWALCVADLVLAVLAEGVNNILTHNS